MISVVTPTLRRPEEMAGLLENLSRQSLRPTELIVVDGAPEDERKTEEVVTAATADLPFRCRYIRRAGGTAIQRNTGLEAATGDLVAFVDDDVRLAHPYFEIIARLFAADTEKRVGGIVGYRTNRHFTRQGSPRWRWYYRLKLLSTYEPGRYDYESGYPINANLQPPFSGVREVDFMTSSCSVWRREVFAEGLRFDPFFKDYGVLEDAHLSLRAKRRWTLWQCGDAHCEELHAPGGRANRRSIGRKCVVNYYYVFQDVSGPLTWRHRWRFWRFQAFELFRIGTSMVRCGRWSDCEELRGRLEGMAEIARGVRRRTWARVMAEGGHV